MIKWFQLFYKSTLSKHRNLFFFIIIFIIYKINSEEIVAPYLKAIYIGNGFYYLIFPDQINYYKPDVKNVEVHSLNSGNKIQSKEELKMINYGQFNDDNYKNIIIFKDYLYYVLDNDYSSNEQLNNMNAYPSEIITLSCSSNTCYYILGIINNAKVLNLYLYKRSSVLITSLLKTYTINNVGSEKVSCQLMKYNSNNVLTCFYQNDTSKDIVASSFNIDTLTPSISIIESLTNSKQTNGAKIIKSKISQDGTQSYVCYITDDKNCDCLIYNISNNEWRDHKTYLTDCIISLDSLNFEYYDISKEFFLYCFQSELKFNLVKLNQNFQITNQKFNGVYDLEDFILNQKNCQSYFLSTIVYESKYINVLLTCDNQLLRKKYLQKILTTTETSIITSSSLTMTSLLSSTIPLFTQVEEKLPIESSIIYKTNTTNMEVNNNKIIIQKRSNKTKEEIIETLDNGMDNYDIGKIYEIFGSDYTVKISPINTQLYENISTYINFSNCENILREENEISPSSILTVYQIEINNYYEKSLINDVEYAVFNENKKRIDLTPCENEIIEINYQLNKSGINLTKASYYSELGIDIYNIEDEFFNDICYPYSEHNSDIILKDRISDIYENYSLCENNCKYDKINMTYYTATCKCTVKIEADSNVDPPNLDTVIHDSIEDTNFGVIKCYRLVFSFQNKQRNIGFWIFTVLIFLHIPFFIYYFIFNIKHMKTFIFNEMGKYHYLYKLHNPKKKKDDITITDIVQRHKTHKLNNKKNALNYLDNSSKKVIFFNKNKKIDEKSYHLDLYNPNISQSNSKSSNNLKRSEILNIHKKNRGKINRKEQKYMSYNKSSINFDNKKQNKSLKISIRDNKNEKNVKNTNYSLIQIDANNSKNTIPPNSDIILDNYDYETAIKYDKRNFPKILYICLLEKDNIINIIFFKTPLDLQSLRICNFIFSYSCDLAFNTLFYSNQSISDKYHYKGNNLFIFTLVNNVIQSIISSVVGLILVNVFQHMFDYRGNFEEVFRNEEKKLRNDKKYKVNKETKKEIFDEIKKIFSNLKCKIILFIIFEFIIMLFFYYFVTAFCEVYKNTQINWLEDFLSSFMLSFAGGIIEALVIAVFYVISLKYKSKFIYKISLFFYNI